MNYFILTMQYNEDYMLPIFLNHYSRFLDPKHIKVIDHGSTTISEHTSSNYERIYIPRSRPFSEGSRLRVIQHFVSGLLEYYDFGIFVDCDELIDLTNIKDIDFTNYKIHHVAGFDVFFRNTTDGLKLYGLLNPTYCKPSVFSYMPYWIPGFHEANSPINILNMPMIHTKFLYKKQSIDRLNIRNQIYHNIIEHEKQGGVAIHWSDSLSHFNSFYEYVNNNECTHPKSFSPIDPDIYSDNAERDKGYKFSNVEYDLTKNFPHIVNNYNILC